jgi:regulator of sirC expression with transglutaminase-like and TPR domain
VETVEAFSMIVRRAPIDAVRLDAGALCIVAAAAHAQVFDPDTPVGALDDLAARVPEPTFDALAQWLFVTEGFTGNRAAYDDPRNSYLPDLLTRRLGIPITLSVLMMEVGRRVGVAVHGIGMPGHFLVGDASRAGVYADPFDGGALLDRAGCVARFAAVRGPGLEFREAFLQPIDHVAILDRMLANLQNAFVGRSRRDLRWVTRLRLVIPNRSRNDREVLAGVLAEVGDFNEAATIFEGLRTEAENAGADADALRLVGRANAARAKSN